MTARKLQGVIYKTNGFVVNFPILVDLVYDAENNPLAVQMIIDGDRQGDIVWVFSRDLMASGLRSYTTVGQGDVRFRYNPTDNALLVCLRRPEGHADLGLPAEGVAAFLEKASEEAPFGAEELDSHIDELIEELLS